MNNKVIIVDEHDNPLGIMGKLQAHQENCLHRAFSVVLLNKADSNYCLVQQRQINKYHCGGLWTNTCCSHPQPGESIEQAGQRRLQEELGITANLECIGAFYYQASFDNGLHEHEYDHVLIGNVDANIPMQLNPEEVQAVRWMSLEEALALSKTTNATPWFQSVLELVLSRS